MSDPVVLGIEQEIYRRRALIDLVRQEPPTGVDSLSGALEIQGFLGTAGDACRTELLVLQAGEVTGLPELCRPLLEREVRVRILCRHRDRADLDTWMKLQRLAEAGAEIGTVSRVPRSAVVFDRRSVALFCGRSVARIHHQDVAGFLIDLFEHLWESTAPVESGPWGYHGVHEDLYRSIADLMAMGYTDEVVARKLGLSVRSCRRHIAGLMRDLKARGRFQAGVRAARQMAICR